MRPKNFPGRVNERRIKARDRLAAAIKRSEFRGQEKKVAILTKALENTITLEPGNARSMKSKIRREVIKHG